MNFTTLETISLRASTSIDTEDVRFILCHFVRCKVLDLTDCSESPKSLYLASIVDGDNAEIPGLGSSLSMAEITNKKSSTADVKTEKKRSRKEKLKMGADESKRAMSATLPLRLGSTAAVEQHSASSLSSAHKNKYYHPFLRFQLSASGDFMGLKLTEFSEQVNQAETRALYEQYWATNLRLRQHYGAKLMQRLRRKYNNRVLELKMLRRDKWADFKISRIVLIQSAIRRTLAKRHITPILLAGRRISRMGQDWLIYRTYLKCKAARKYYVARLRRTSFLKMLKNRQTSSELLKGMATTMTRSNELRRLRWYWALLKAFEIEYRDDAFALSAGVVWETQIFKKIFAHWRTVLFETSNHKQKLVKVFMQCVSIAAYNSTRQKCLARQALSFYDRLVLMPAWLGFCYDLLEAKRIKALVPLGMSYHCISSAIFLMWCY
jgi:hypothetical protein